MKIKKIAIRSLIFFFGLIDFHIIFSIKNSSYILFYGKRVILPTQFELSILKLIQQYEMPNMDLVESRIIELLYLEEV